MSIEKMFDIKEIIRKELNICGDLLNNDDFNTLIIYGNRIMENNLFSNDFRLFLPGFFLKELALTFSALFRSKEPKAFQTAKLVGNEFINALNEILKEELDEELLWTKFHLFKIKIQEYLKSESEKKHYEDNIKFSKYVLVYLIEFLKNNENMLYEVDNQFLGAILSVLERIFRVHSGSLEFTLVNSYLKMLIRLYGYLIVKYFREEKLDKENLKRELETHLEYIIEAGVKDKIEIKEFNEKLWEIVKQWRFYYLYYRNPPLYGGPLPQKVIQLSEETKKIIEESIKDSIEKKL